MQNVPAQHWQRCMSRALFYSLSLSLSLASRYCMNCTSVYACLCVVSTQLATCYAADVQRRSFRRTHIVYWALSSMFLHLSPTPFYSLLSHLCCISPLRQSWFPWSMNIPEIMYLYIHASVCTYIYTYNIWQWAHTHEWMCIHMYIAMFMNAQLMQQKVLFIKKLHGCIRNDYIHTYL